MFVVAVFPHLPVLITALKTLKFPLRSEYDNLCYKIMISFFKVVWDVVLSQYS